MHSKAGSPSAARSPSAMTEPCEPHPADRRDLIRERNAPTLVPRRAEHHPLVADDEWERPERLSHRDMRQVYNRRDTGGAGGLCAEGSLSRLNTGCIRVRTEGKATSETRRVDVACESRTQCWAVL